MNPSSLVWSRSHKKREYSFTRRWGAPKENKNTKLFTKVFTWLLITFLRRLSALLGFSDFSRLLPPLRRLFRSPLLDVSLVSDKWIKSKKIVNFNNSMFLFVTDDKYENLNNLTQAVCFFCFLARCTYILGFSQVRGVSIGQWGRQRFEYKILFVKFKAHQLSYRSLRYN